jgi:N-acetylglucosamine-6-phosphate deacetylase
LHQDVVLDGARIIYVGDTGTAIGDGDRISLAGRWLAPGFVDLQVNGAGGALFQAAPDRDSLRRMETALRGLGVTGFLPTLTSAQADTILRTAEKVGEHIASGPCAVLGLNLEGPFINASKAGMANADDCVPFDVELVRETAARISPGKLYLTVAPENVGDVKSLDCADVIFAIGHTTASYEQARKFFDNGVRVSTHLFNAMTGISGREPGVAGAVLDSTVVSSSLIADGYHVHPANARLAFGRLGLNRLFLISDGMPPLGSNVREFQYGSHIVTEEDGRCMTEDGVLAGTAVSIGQGLNNLAHWLDVDIASLVPLVTSVPMQVLGLDTEHGRICEGTVANLIVTDSSLAVEHVIVQGDLSALQ